MVKESREIRADKLRVGQRIPRPGDYYFTEIVHLERASDDRIVLQLKAETAMITLRAEDVVRVGLRPVSELLQDMKSAAEASDMDALADLVDEAFESGYDQIF